MDVKQDVSKMSISKPELLAPAGDMEKLRLAVLYGRQRFQPARAGA